MRINAEIRSAASTATADADVDDKDGANDGGAGSGKPRLVLRSSNGRDVTGSFPELQALAEAMQADVVLDGEVVVFDGDRPSFARLQQRIHVDKPHAVVVTEHPVVFIVFDLLMLDGNPLIDLPYKTRRRLLDDLLPSGPNWRTPALRPRRRRRAVGPGSEPGPGGHHRQTTRQYLRTRNP